MSFSNAVDAVITQFFGSGKELSWQLGHGHLGIDYGVQVGTEIKAVGAGRVLWSNWGGPLADRSWAARWYLVPENAGICVVIDHGDYISVYGHLNESFFEPGDYVAAGQVVGKSGNTGLSTGPHLHLELVRKSLGYQNGTYGRVDPLPLMTGAVAPSAPVVPQSNTLIGVDISNHQAGINVGALGAGFTIVKASEGVGWADPQLAQNVASARSAGSLVGFYHFSRFGAADGNSPEAEAASFLQFIAPFLQDGDLVVLDLESDDQSPGVSKRFLDVVSNATGRKCLIYMNLSTARANGWDAVKAVYPLWLAWYPSDAPGSWSPVAALPSLPGWNVAMWQHTQTGRLAGWNGNLDLNVFYGDRQAWNDLAGGRGFTPVSVVAPSTSTTNAVRSDLLIVEAGDSFSGIAVAWGFDLQAFKDANPGLNYNLIHPGDLLNVPSGTAAPRAASAGVSQCVVEPGDTFSGIAIQFGVDLQAFKNANPGIDHNLIYPKQVLNLPVAVSAPVAAQNSGGVSQCIVEPGDTLSGIAAQFGVSVEQIINANPGINPDLIYPKQVLNLR